MSMQQPVEPGRRRVRPIPLVLAIGLAVSGAQAENPIEPADHLVEDLIAAGASPGLPDWLLEMAGNAARVAPLFASRGGPHVQVTSCADSGPGSLREAVANAPEDATIELDDLPCSTISLTTGRIVVSQENLALQGPGADLLTISGIQSPGEGILSANESYGELTISDLTIAHGRNIGHGVRGGGCIYTSGNLLLYKSVVTDCVVGSVDTPSGYGVAASGGGVSAARDLTLKYSTISNNTAYVISAEDPLYDSLADGGGADVGLSGGSLLAKYSSISGNETWGSGENLYVEAGGLELLGESGATIRGCTISGNTGGSTGGISSHGLFLSNSTVSGNSASYGTGGIRASNLDVRNSTIVSNSGGTDPAAIAATATTGLQSGGVLAPDLVANSTVFFGNVFSGAPLDTSVGTFTGANNLVGHALGATPPVDTLVGIDPQLLPLADRGGNHLPVHMPISASPVVDAGNNIDTDPDGPLGQLNKDQRGFDRVVGAGADIGAVERQGPLEADLIFADGFEPPPAGVFRTELSASRLRDSKSVGPSNAGTEPPRGAVSPTSHAPKVGKNRLLSAVSPGTLTGHNRIEPSRPTRTSVTWQASGGKRSVQRNIAEV